MAIINSTILTIVVAALSIAWGVFGRDLGDEHLEMMLKHGDVYVRGHQGFPYRPKAGRYDPKLDELAHKGSRYANPH